MSYNTILTGSSLAMGGGISNPWIGSLSLPQIWNRALSQTEISSLYSNPQVLGLPGNIVPVLTDAGTNGSVEDAQHAQTAAFLQYGSVPQLPTFGVQWAEYFTGGVNFGVIDGQIKSNLSAVGLTQFRPTYDLVNDKLTVSVVSK